MTNHRWADLKHKIKPMAISDGSEMTSRCDICGKPFPIVLVDGKLVDADDRTRNVQVDSNTFVHGRCFKE